MLTADECLKAAFADLLRGDTAERDRLCKLAAHINGQQDRAADPTRGTPGNPIRLVLQPDGSYGPEN